ncbi:ABC transporter permease [bacterium]|nr:ABC transporter permease [bacterium]
MQVLRRLWSSPLTALGMLLVLLALLSAAFCNVLSPFSPVRQYRGYQFKPPGTQLDEDVRVAARAEGDRPGSAFALGTDIHGRDVLSRVLYGARISMLVGVVATLLNLLIGVAIGILAGFYGGWLDSFLMRLTDTFFAFPGTLLAIIILATLSASLGDNYDPGMLGLFLALGLTGWTGIARVIRGTVLALKEREFVEAARAIGCGNLRIMLVHILPNCMAPVIVLGTMQVAYNILSEAGLSFLGLGVQAPSASWGGMLADARPFFKENWWWGLFPGLALGLAVLGFNLFGDGLRDVLDPRLRARS